jgi:hypothetical protein
MDDGWLTYTTSQFKQEDTAINQLSSHLYMKENVSERPLQLAAVYLINSPAHNPHYIVSTYLMFVYFLTAVPLTGK